MRPSSPTNAFALVCLLWPLVAAADCAKGSCVAQNEHDTISLVQVKQSLKSGIERSEQESKSESPVPVLARPHRPPFSAVQEGSGADANTTRFACHSWKCNGGARRRGHGCGSFHAKVQALDWTRTGGTRGQAALTEEQKLGLEKKMKNDGFHAQEHWHNPVFCEETYVARSDEDKLYYDGITCTRLSEKCMKQRYPNREDREKEVCDSCRCTLHTKRQIP